ncbi:esterase family protein [Actinomadura craniellae]|uniref:Esterase family protein n=1 Tax=Actinomadura craniellae TaxID=2231787 RepID=A0A365H706_9ACTN|nr:alpha/beta hydrolase family protein [Actinomadura craniellae]RAY14861.1 esterase family protein [Actinomadura craniellae]
MRISRVAGVLAGAALVTGSLVVPAAAAPAFVPADTGARITGEQWLDSATVDLTVSTPSLDGPQLVRVIVPAGWSREASRTWPVVYAYHGGRDTAVSWTRSTDIEQVAARYDVIVVMPEGGWNGSHANWHNFGLGGRPKWETFHVQEVVQLAERNLRAGTQRAVMGASSGGQGALAYAGRHPGTFRYAASFSSVLHMTTPAMQSLVLTTAAVWGGVWIPGAIYGWPLLNEFVWRAHDAYHLVPKLKGTGLYVSAGTTGNPGPFEPTDANLLEQLAGRLIGGFGEATVGASTRSFVDEARRRGVPVTANLYGNGWHQWAYWDAEYKKAWPLMMDTIGARQVG